MENTFTVPPRTNITPAGVIFKFEMKNGKTYFVLLYVNFDREKVYGNTNIESNNIVIFDDLMNRVEYDDDIYPDIEKYVIDRIINEDW